MLRVYPLLRERLSVSLCAAGPAFDDRRLSLGVRRAGVHAAYAAFERAEQIAARLTDSDPLLFSVSASCGYVNVSFSAAALGGYLSAFADSLPAYTLCADVPEDALFSPLLYGAARLSMFAGLAGDAELSCPGDDAARDALFALYALGEPVGADKRRRRAIALEQTLCALVDSIPTNHRAKRLQELSGIVRAGSRALYAAYRLVHSDKKEEPI